MATPLTDSINALTTYANEVTGASDTNLSDAVHTLASGYGGGGSGASSWTKVAETSYQVSTTSTTAKTVDMWATGHSELWTAKKFVYVRIRDTAGKRAGYFYGSDNFFLVFSSDTFTSTSIRFHEKYTSSDTYELGAASTTTGYGVYADMLYSDGRIRIRERYNSGASLTIDGTYKVEVYLLDPPTGAPIFE
jgi:hypothetical protein